MSQVYVTPNGTEHSLNLTNLKNRLVFPPNSTKSSHRPHSPVRPLLIRQPRDKQPKRLQLAFYFPCQSCGHPGPPFARPTLLKTLPTPTPSYLSRSVLAPKLDDKT